MSDDLDDYRYGLSDLIIESSLRVLSFAGLMGVYGFMLLSAVGTIFTPGGRLTSIVLLWFLVLYFQKRSRDILYLLVFHSFMFLGWVLVCIDTLHSQGELPWHFAFALIAMAVRAPIDVLDCAENLDCINKADAL